MSAVMPPSPAVSASAQAQATADRAAAEVKAAASPVTDAASPGAVARLAASRSRLKGAMTPSPRRPKRTTTSGKPLFSSDGVSEAARTLLAKAQGLPGADVVRDAVDVWWKGHPLHTAGVVAGEAGEAWVRPIARRNPYGFVLTAAAAGAFLWWTRPWRWALRPILFAGLVPQIASQALRRMPASSWTRVADLVLKSKQRKTAAPVVSAVSGGPASTGTVRADPAATI